MKLLSRTSEKEEKRSQTLRVPETRKLPERASNAAVPFTHLYLPETRRLSEDVAFFAKDGCRTKGSLMTLANLRWSYL